MKQALQLETISSLRVWFITVLGPEIGKSSENEKGGKPTGPIVNPDHPLENTNHHVQEGGNVDDVSVTLACCNQRDALS